jgi:DNA-binding NtrC family response regulator
VTANGSDGTQGLGPYASIPHPTISRRHASVQHGFGVPILTDLGSSNGTRVDGQLIREPTPLIAQSVVRFGDTLAVVDEHAPEGVSDLARAIPGTGPNMARVRTLLERAAPESAAMLISGETGTGKEWLAAALHGSSGRSGPYLKLSCAELSPHLVESELFGHERGAFTGAERRRTGYFEAASGGTLLLDEIGEMPSSVQAKLLRVLERRAIVRVGGTDEVIVDVRIICATNRDLRREVEAGRFRQDLYYRISTFTLEVPPLRERPTEVVLLAELFVARFAEDLGLPKPRLGFDAIEALGAHPWPGNVRELRNTMEHAVVMANGGVVRKEHLPTSFASAASAGAPGIRGRVEEMERAALVAALAAEGDNRTRAAKRLGLSRRALLYKIAKYGLRD